jgi:L-threonylcarbamoyladenylate synthase
MSGYPPEIEQAAAALRAGDLVAFATETVYGLGADAESASGVAQIYQRKGRPAGHPLIVHVATQGSACFWGSLGPAGHALAAAFWPGPLTLIATRDASVASFACGEEPTIGLRCPSHPVAQSLLQAFEENGGHGVAAPSANLFGGVSPTGAEHVRDDFGNGLNILDGGNSQIGLESTIVDVSREVTTILRPGAIGSAQINDVLAARGLHPLDRHQHQSGAPTPKVAGSLAAHYAPRTPMRLTASTRIDEQIRQLLLQGVSLAVCSANKPVGDVRHWEQAAPDPTRFGARIYALLREFDQLGVDQIVIESPPDETAWTAVLDRLQRAQTGSG